MSEKIEIDLQMFQRNWATIALLIIFALSFYVRVFNFHYDYLLNVDSYFHYRYIKFIVDDGSIPAIDHYMLSPDGMQAGGNFGVSNLYHYVGAYSFMLTRIFFPDLELWRFLVYFPAFLASLMIIPAFIIGKALFDKKAGVLFAFLVVFSPAIFMRTIGGDPDNDAMVLLMPLLVMMFFILSQKTLEASEKLFNKKAIFYSALTGIFLAGFALSWIGYWYIFYLMLGFALSKISLSVFLKKKEDTPMMVLKSYIPMVFNFAIIILIFIILTSPFFGPGLIFRTVSDIFSTSQMKAETGNYPNVMVSVQEMMAFSSLKEIIQRTGDAFFFLTFVLCLPYLIGTYFKKRAHMDTALLIILWSVGTLFATTIAVRFSILLAIPVTLGSAIILAKLWRMVLGEDKEIFE